MIKIRTKNLALPSDMEEKLAAVKRRKTKVELRRALMHGAVAFLTLMLCAMAIDWVFVLFSTTIRCLLTLTTIVVAALVCISNARRVLRYRSNWDQVAAEIDEETPVLQERWSTVTNLFNDGRASLIDSRVLEHVTREAVVLESYVVPEEVAAQPWSSKTKLAVGALAAVMLATVVCDPPKFTTLALRFFAPTANISMTRLGTHGTPAVAARDEPFTLEAEAHGRIVEEANLLIREGNELAQAETVFPSDLEHRFRHRIKSVEAPFSYRWRAGDGQTKWLDVEVADRPELAAVSLRAIPPTYSGRKPLDWDFLPKRVAIPQGSQVVVRVLPTSTEDVVFAKVSDTLPSLAKRDASQDGWFEWRLIAEEDFELCPVLTEVHRLRNRKRPVCRVQVRPDESPKVSITEPSEETVASLDDEIEISFRAQDDHGIAKAELLVYQEDDFGQSDDEPVAVIPIELPAEGQRELEASTYLDLRQLELEDGDSIRYSVRVYDSRQQVSDADAVEQSDAARQPDAAESDPFSDPNDQQEVVSQDIMHADMDNEPQEAAQPSARTAATNPPPQADSSPQQTASSSIQSQTDKNSEPLSQTEPQSPPVPDTNDERPMLVQEGSPDQVSDEEPSQPPISPKITQRRLDISQTGESAAMRLKVDSEVGDYASQQRRKLEIAIAPVLKRIDQLLDSAATQTNRVVKDLEGGSESVREHDRALSTASRDTSAASSAVDRLLERTTDTAYAFVGLQIADIRDSYLDSASDSLKTSLSTRGAERLPPSRAAWQDIRRAQERLSQLSASFERVRREMQLADNVKRIKKMYTVFVEDSLAVMQMGQQRINRYETNPAEFELDEEYLSRLKQVLEMQRDLRAELAKILADDPRLMRRFTQSMRGKVDNLRDQMTLLVERQKDLSGELERFDHCDEAGTAEDRRGHLGQEIG